MLYMVTFTINIPPMLAYIPYMDPMGYNSEYVPRRAVALLHWVCCGETGSFQDARMVAQKAADVLGPSIEKLPGNQLDTSHK